MDLTQIDLGKVAGSAQAAVALIIANSIFLSQVTTKSTALYETYRKLTTELRELNPANTAEGRGQGLREQVDLYRWRCNQIRRATCLLNISEMVLLVCVLATALDVAFPNQPVIRIVGALTLVVGLCMLGTSAAMELSENRRSREAIESELIDVPAGDPAPSGTRAHA